jgi:SnoaL-like domain
MHPFRAAIEAQDLKAALALLAEDAVFRSPIVFKPYRGREAIAPLLLAVSRVFEDFRYEREIGAPEARDHALVFKARIGDRELEGCDFLHTDEHGLIDEFCVMVRPLSGALALAEAMRAELESAQRELGAGAQQAAGPGE